MNRAFHSGERNIILKGISFYGVENTVGHA
jgi:hypothetical protein